MRGSHPRVLVGTPQPFPKPMFSGPQRSLCLVAHPGICYVLCVTFLRHHSSDCSQPPHGPSYSIIYLGACPVLKIPSSRPSSQVSLPEAKEAERTLALSGAQEPKAGGISFLQGWTPGRGECPWVILVSAQSTWMGREPQCPFVSGLHPRWDKDLRSTCGTLRAPRRLMGLPYEGTHCAPR